MTAALSLVHRVRPARSHGARAAAKPPLLILMHGVGSNERSLTTIADSFDERLVVLSVRSPLELGADSFGFFHVTFGNDGPVIVAAEAIDGWQRVARFIGEAEVAYNADPQRVYVAGFSQGGIMSLAAMLTVPEKLAGAVCMSGRLLPEVLPFAADRSQLIGKPIMIVHGTLDDKLRIDYARSARDTLAPFGFDISYKEYPMRHQISPQTLADVSAWLTAQLDATERA